MRPSVRMEYTAESLFEPDVSMHCTSQDFDDDLVSANSRGTINTSARGGEEGIASRETRALTRLRLAGIFVLVGTATAVCIVAYIFTRNNEIKDLESSFYDQASRVVDAFQINAQQRVRSIEAFALSIASHATFSNSSWPFITLPDFERRGVAVAELAQVMSLIFAPIIRDSIVRSQWESYSVMNQMWFGESLAVKDNEPFDKTGVNPYPIPQAIYRVEGVDPAPETGPGPYLPIWQIAPIVPFPALVNFNLLSHPGYIDGLNAIFESETTTLSRSFEVGEDDNDPVTAGRKASFDLFLERWDEINGDQTGGYQGDPVVDLHIPIFDGFDPSSRKMVAMLTCVIYWRTYFLDLLPDNANGVILVLRNTCDQSFTYQISGSDAIFLGAGDLHLSDYERFKEETEFGIFLQQQETTNNGNCRYKITVYPSQELIDEFITRNPTWYTVVLVMVFMFTSSVFVLYDCIVERRQRVVMDNAVASSAIVSQLFPKVVRDRLYNNNGGAIGDQLPPQVTPVTPPQPKKKSNEADDDDGPRSLSHSRHRLQSFLQEGTKGTQADKAPNTGASSSQSQNVSNNSNSKPIADLFDDCTVLFADIAGFTAWSSGREPAQVFTLLETLYGAFDKIAKRRRVFKVETIGDCYLAVTGLPEPQKDHAVIMALFSHECMRKMKMLMAIELKNVLFETENLTMRFGLHSGPVTAGVLRGAKSRFQLFGDTVNTAARMESTGLRDRIQASQETANLIMAAGKHGWLEERSEPVQAKGKGQLKTYWVKPKANYKDLNLNNNKNSSGEDVPPPVAQAPRSASLDLTLMKTTWTPTVPSAATGEYNDNNDTNEESVPATHRAASLDLRAMRDYKSTNALAAPAVQSFDGGTQTETEDSNPSASTNSLT